LPEKELADALEDIRSHLLKYKIETEPGLRFSKQNRPFSESGMDSSLSMIQRKVSYQVNRVSCPWPGFLRGEYDGIGIANLIV